MQTATQIPAGYRLNSWLALVGFGRSKYYALPEELKPHSITIDGMRLIIEPPADWLARVKVQQQSERRSAKRGTQ